MPETTTFPLKEDALKEIAQKACSEALSGATEYNHTDAQTWNKTIINKMIESLVAATAPEEGKTPPYKFAINSTVLQNSAGGGSSERRGMFSSVGAFWNSEKDGMWSYKYDVGEKLGLDVVMSVIWIAI